MRPSVFGFLFLVSLSASAQPPRRTDTLTLVGVGDVMLGTTYPAGYLPPHDGERLLRAVEPALQNADLTFGNHEGTLFDGEGTPKRCADSLRCYAFRSPERYAAHLRRAGFDAMSVANNHSGDFGPVAQARTVEVLRAAGIAAAGTERQPFTVVVKGGVRYGLAAFAPNRGTPSLHNIAAAQRTVRRLDSLCDIVIVSFHGGAEGLAHQRVPRKRELFLGEDRGDVYRFARAVIDAGADVVFGHGPHVARAVDVYKNRFIAYSLGNFATYGRFNLKAEAGLAPIVRVSIDRKGRFLEGQIVAARQVGEGGPVSDSSGEVIDRIRQLTASDFPESQLRIAADGRITQKESAPVRKKRNTPSAIGNTQRATSSR